MASSAPPDPKGVLARKLQDWGISREQRVFLACSGGADSMALLWAAYHLGQAVEVLHVDHGWHPDSPRWARQILLLSKKLGYPARILSLPSALTSGEGPEDRARRGRYAVLAAQLGPGDLVLTAHHQDDQAETVLLQLLRGAGLDGLAAMPERRPLGRGILARPFLECTHQDLLDYVQSLHGSWLEDPANTDLRFARSRIRTQILPALRDLGWRASSQSLAQSARQLADLLPVQEQWYQDQANKIWGGADRSSVPCSALQDWCAAEQRVFLRQWLRERGFARPDWAGLERIRQLLTPGRAGRLQSWEGNVAWVQGGRLSVWRSNFPWPIAECTWCASAPAGRTADFSWSWEGPPARWQNEDGPIWVVAGLGEGVSSFHWRRRRPGDFYQNAQGQHRPLKKLLLERGVPPCWRQTIPLLWDEAGHLLLIPGFYEASGKGPRQLWIRPVSSEENRNRLPVPG